MSLTYTRALAGPTAAIASAAETADTYGTAGPDLDSLQLALWQCTFSLRPAVNDSQQPNAFTSPEISAWSSQFFDNSASGNAKIMQTAISDAARKVYENTDQAHSQLVIATLKTAFDLCVAAS